MKAQSGRQSSTLSLTTVLDWSGWLTPRLGHFTTGKDTRYPLYRRLSGPLDLTGQVRKISPPPEFDPRTVQPLLSRSSDSSNLCNFLPSKDANALAWHLRQGWSCPIHFHAALSPIVLACTSQTVCLSTYLFILHSGRLFSTHIRLSFLCRFV